MQIPKRISASLINSLRGGVVPRIGLPYIAVGREGEINALLHDIDIIENGGAGFRFVSGRYGSGKSFLMQMIRSHVMDRNFVVMDADLSPERRLSGSKGQGLATYRELMSNISTKTRPEGGALALILEKWISGIKTDLVLSGVCEDNSDEFNKMIQLKVFEVIGEIEDMVHGFDFAKAVSIYYKAYTDGDEDKKGAALRWFRGEYTTKAQVKAELGINVIINDEDWYDYIKLFSLFLVKAGYSGLLIIIDELVNIYKIPNSITRQYNYEKILTMYNDALQGKAKYMGILMGATPKCIEDSRKGIFSYEALKSRLEKSRFNDGKEQDMLSPVIYLSLLSQEEIFVLIEKLAAIHKNLFEYAYTLTDNEIEAFIKAEYSRVYADENLTPREIIRDFIELMNIIYQNKGKDFISLLGEQADNLGKNESGDIDDEFADFDV